MSPTLRACFQRREPQHASLPHGTRQRRATGVRGKPGLGSSSSLCSGRAGQPQASLRLRAAGGFPQAGAASGRHPHRHPQLAGSAAETAHTVRFCRRRAACSSHNSWNAGCISEGHLTFVPYPRVSPQVNQDYNHKSKDRIVLFFPFFFFLKGVRAWKIQHTDETKMPKNTKK